MQIGAINSDRTWRVENKSNCQLFYYKLPRVAGNSQFSDQSVFVLWHYMKIKAQLSGHPHPIPSIHWSGLTIFSIISSHHTIR